MTITPLVRCDGTGHAEGVNGHRGSASYRVRVECPACDYAATKMLCGGRVKDARAFAGRMLCPRCGHTAQADVFWRSVDPLEQLPAAPAKPAGLELLTGWQRHLEAAGRRPETVRVRLGCVRRFSTSRPDLLTLTTSDLEAGLAEARATLGPSGLRNVRNSLRGFYQWAYRERLVPRDPSADLAPVRVPPTQSRIASDQQVRAGLARADAAGRAMILLARYAGLRRAEIAALRTSDRDGERLRIDGKGGHIRTVLIAQELEVALDAIEEADGVGFYFPGRIGGHVHVDTVHSVITKLVGINPHALRHAAATAAYRATHDLQAVQEFLGHASLATTQVYLHVSDSQLRAVAVATRLTPEKSVTTGGRV